MSKKTLGCILALVMMLTLSASAFAVPGQVGSVEIPAELPRNETLYFAGQQWGTVLS
jgi:hypothetical protein